MFSKVTIGGVAALFLAQVSESGLSGLDYDISYSSSGNGTECAIEECLYLGSEDACWEIPVSDSDSFVYLQEICDTLEFIGCEFEDLVWRTEEYDNDWDGVYEIDCDDCPGCTCSIEGDLQYFERDIGGLYKECFVCNCTDFNAHDDQTDLAWDCGDYYGDSSYIVYWYEDNFDSFQCPYSATAQECSYGGYDHDLGEPFLKSTGTQCDEFCYCGYDGTETCDSVSNVIADTDSDLYTQFIDDCGWSLRYCIDEPSTWVYDQEDESDSYFYCSCPRCGCSGTIDSYISYVDPNPYFDFEYNGCGINCECSDDYTYTYGSNIIYCDDSYESVQDIECPSTLECVNWDVWTYSYSINGDDTTTVTTVDQDVEGCISATQTYCGNSLQTDFGWYSGGLYTGVDYVSGCQESFLCEIGSINDNQCVSYDVSFDATVTSCDGGDSTGTFTDTVEFTDYLQCCQGSYCNNQTYDGDSSIFDTSSCTESSLLGTLFSGVYACQTSEEITDEIGELLYCASDTWYETLTVCEYLEAYIGQLVGCYCQAMGGIYDDVDSSIQNSMQDFMDNYLAEMEVFTEAYECQLTYECDLEAQTLNVFYTEYVVSFDLTLTSYNDVTYDEDTVTDYIAGVIGLNSGNVELTNVVTATDSVSMTVIVTFEDEDDAESFSTDLTSSSSSYDFGTGSSVSDVSDVTEVKNAVPKGSANSNKIGFVAVLLTSIALFLLA